MNHILEALVGLVVLLVCCYLALFAFFSGVSLGMHWFGMCFAGVCP